jgi:hypothetical protein
MDVGNASQAEEEVREDAKEADNRERVYDIETVLWGFKKPSVQELAEFDRGFSKQTMILFFKLLRANPELSHNAVVAPELGGITAGEMALMHIRADFATRRKRRAERLAGVPRKPNSSKNNAKRKKMASPWTRVARIKQASTQSLLLQQ